TCDRLAGEPDHDACPQCRAPYHTCWGCFGWPIQCVMSTLQVVGSRGARRVIGEKMWKSQCRCGSWSTRPLFYISRLCASSIAKLESICRHAYLMHTCKSQGDRHVCASRGRPRLS